MTMKMVSHQLKTKTFSLNLALGVVLVMAEDRKMWIFFGAGQMNNLFMFTDGWESTAVNKITTLITVTS